MLCILLHVINVEHTPEQQQEPAAERPKKAVRRDSAGRGGPTLAGGGGRGNAGRGHAALGPSLPPADLHLAYVSIVEKELAAFMQETIIPQDDDPLQWWCQRQGKYPWLSRLARRCLCVPATSASSERLFSSAGLTVTKLRNRLSDEHITTLVYLRNVWPVLENWQADLAFDLETL